MKWRWEGKQKMEIITIEMMEFYSPLKFKIMNTFLQTASKLRISQKLLHTITAMLIVNSHLECGSENHNVSSGLDPGLSVNLRIVIICIAVINRRSNTARAWKRSIQRFVITEIQRRPLLRASSWMRAPTSTLTFKTLLRHYANQHLFCIVS